MASPKLKLVEHKPTPLQSLVGDYLAHQRGRGLSPRTIKQAVDVVERQFLPWSVKEGITAPDQLSQRVLDRFGTHLLEDRTTPTGKPLARETVRTYLRTLGQFLRWAQSEDAVPAKVKLQTPARQRRLLETLSREEIQRMEDVVSAERDKLMVRLLADTGIRLGELLGLRATDLAEQGRERYIKVKGKGSRERLVPVAPALFLRLRRYAQRGRPTQARSERIFLTNRRSAKTGDYEAVSARAVQDVVGYAAQVAGIQRSVHPHLFRHSYATWALRKGMNPLQLQRILGHADLTMISGVYSHLTPSDSYAALMDLLRADD
jgi:integrase/recombinase XerD